MASTSSLPSPDSVAQGLRSSLPSALAQPVLAIVLGSGLSSLSELLQDRVDVEYERIPGFNASTVAGHQSKLCFGTLAGVPVVCQAGRFHLYEGKSLAQVTFPVRVFKALGCRGIILTNAAGGLNPSFKVPTIAVVQDHFALPALAGLNPLIGPNDDAVGLRFPPMSNAYDIELQKIAYRAGQQLGLRDGLLRSGTYAWVTGPTYETRADCKFLREYAGADMVGMSTVPEVIVARHADMRVLGLSLITNKVIASPYRDIKAEVAAEASSQQTVPATEEPEEATSHEEVLAVGKQATKEMSALVERIVELAGPVL